jgi:hypothetical protein
VSDIRAEANILESHHSDSENQAIMLRTRWVCPNCNELNPTRHESVIRHIHRKHESFGEPISINTRQTRRQMLEHVSPNAFYAPYLKTPWLNYRQPFMISRTQAEQDSKGKDERTDALSDLAMKTQQIKLLSDINQNLKYLQNQNATIINMLVQMFQSKK